MNMTMFRKTLLSGKLQNGIRMLDGRGFHRGSISLFMHERHANVEENRKRIGIVGGAICAGQVF